MKTITSSAQSLVSLLRNIIDVQVLQVLTCRYTRIIWENKSTIFRK